MLSGWAVVWLISIHALRVEGDHRYLGRSFEDPLYFYPRPPGGGRRRNDRKPMVCGRYFYPRPPGGGRLGKRLVLRNLLQFLSTPSGWRATYIPPPVEAKPKFLSTPSGWRATTALSSGMRSTSRFLSTPSGWRRLPLKLSMISVWYDFYPRPPGGGDGAYRYQNLKERRFLSTPSGWRRQQKQTKFSSVFAQKGEEFASLRRGKRKFAGGVLKRTNFGF